MHMISKKDLNSAEMDTLTKSCSPANILHYGSPRGCASSFIAIAMNTDILTNG